MGQEFALCSTIRQSASAVVTTTPDATPGATKRRLHTTAHPTKDYTCQCVPTIRVAETRETAIEIGVLVLMPPDRPNSVKRRSIARLPLQRPESMRTGQDDPEVMLLPSRRFQRPTRHLTCGSDINLRAGRPHNAIGRSRIVGVFATSSLDSVRRGAPSSGFRTDQQPR